MKQIKRFYELDKLFSPGRVVVLYGARRVGKTTIVKKYLQTVKQKYLFEIGDSLPFRQIMTSMDPQVYRDYFGEYELVVIDEAQFIPGVGKSLKLLIDILPNLKVLVTGSSSFELSGEVGEPLTGRKWEIMLYPVSMFELKQQMTKKELSDKLEEHLLYGMYPEVLTVKSKAIKERILRELVGSYLVKDIFVLQEVKSPQKIWDLLKLLAFQIGSEVSLRELGGQLGMNYKSVSRYIDLLKKSFVIFEVGGFSRNLRKEVVKKKKYYFYDVGVRNAIIERFQKLVDRDDVGQLWENYLVAERVKKTVYRGKWPLLYFWRTWEGQEIDIIEEREGVIKAYEVKWSEKKKVRVPTAFAKSYPQARFEVINRGNYMKWVS